MIRIAAIFILLLFIYSCSTVNIPVSSIRIKGSDTMLILTRLLSEEYMKNNPGISIYIDGGGTASGVKSLIRNEIDICTASRTLTPDEIKMLAENYGTVGVSYLIAKDALSIYINSKNPVSDYTLSRLKDIFTCKIISWSELGGKSSRIIPVIRTQNSGTHLYFKEHVLNNENYCESAEYIATTEDIINYVLHNEDAIGYGGIGFGHKRIKHASVNGVAASEESVRNDTYPISRYLFFYTLNNPLGEIKRFIDWVLSSEGQKIVSKTGFISLFERE